MKCTFCLSTVNIISLLLLTVLLSCCTDKKASNTHVLSASIEPLRYFAEQVAGNGWKVASIVPEGFSPEQYSASATDMTTLSQSKAVFIAGRLPIETTWIKNAATEIPHINIIDTSRGIHLQNFDPHIWMSPRNVSHIYINIANALEQLDRPNAPYYHQRAQEASQRALSLHHTIDSLLTSVASRAFVIVHPALTQFAADYNLIQIPIEVDGKEPTPKTIQSVIERAKHFRAGVVFVQKEFFSQSAQIIAQQIGARVVEINPLAYDWPSQMLRIAKAIKYGK